MPVLRGIKRYFTGGEVTPIIASRDDLAKYASACSVMENFIPQIHGTARFRPGFRFIAELPGKARLVDFAFNTQVKDTYVLCMTEDKVFFIQDDGVVLGDDGQPYTIDNPYSYEESLDIVHAQSADVVYMAQKDNPPRKLQRRGHKDWMFSDINFGFKLGKVTGLTGAWHPGKDPDSQGAAQDYTSEYAVCAVDDKGNQSDKVVVAIKNTRHNSNWIAGDHITLSWTAVPDADSYNIYRAEGGYFGFIGISNGTTFDDQNIQADTADTPPSFYNPFENGNNPAVVTLHQQRLVFGGSDKKPQTWYASRVGDFENFNKSRPLQDDDMLEFTLASGSIDQIKWITSFGDLLIGTAGAEHLAKGGESQSITPASIYVRVQSAWGSGELQPLVIGNSILHVQRQGAKVRDLFYDYASDGYAGNDLSLLAAHMFEDHDMLSWTYQKEPDSIIWVVRDDGQLLALTYLKEHQIWGWTRHVTDGKFLQVVSVPSDQGDVVYALVEREIKGVKRYYVERLENYWFERYGIENAFYVDSGLSLTVAEDQTISSVSGLDHLEGKTVSGLIDGNAVVGLEVKNGKVDLPRAASKMVHIGLGYEGTLVPLPYEIEAQRGTSQGQPKGLGNINIRVYQSLGGKISGDEVVYDELLYNQEVWGDPLPPVTGDMPVAPSVSFSTSATIHIKQDLPLPMNILSIAAEVAYE